MRWPLNDAVDKQRLSGRGSSAGLLAVADHRDDPLFRPVFVIVAVQLTGIMIRDSRFFVPLQAIQERLHPKLLDKPGERPDPPIVQHAAPARKPGAFPTPVQSFFPAALKVLALVLVLAAIIAAARTIRILAARSTSKTTIRDAFLPVQFRFRPFFRLRSMNPSCTDRSRGHSKGILQDNYFIC